MYCSTLLSAANPENIEVRGTCARGQYESAQTRP